MVTPQGFNALLKIVEEPPEHVKFVFATTEPEKVIGTIRSRTHHYPFRLVPPARLQAYMEELCVKEGVAVAPGVLSFVVRAGGGSVRDSLSVLDQLIAGSGADGLTYESAAALLGFTDGELLDAAIDAFAAGDAAVGVPLDRQGRRDRARPAALRRGPPRAAARPHRRRGRHRRCGFGAPPRARGPARADAAPVGRVRSRGPVAGRRRRQRRAHRDDRRHRTAPSARADRRAHPAPRGRRRGRVRRAARPARASPRRRWGPDGGGLVCRARAARCRGTARRDRAPAPPPAAAPLFAAAPAASAPSTPSAEHEPPPEDDAPPEHDAASVGAAPAPPASDAPREPPPAAVRRPLRPQRPSRLRSPTPRGPAASTPTRCAVPGPTCSSG